MLYYTLNGERYEPEGIYGSIAELKELLKQKHNATSVSLQLNGREIDDSNKNMMLMGPQFVVHEIKIILN